MTLQTSWRRRSWSHEAPALTLDADDLVSRLDSPRRRPTSGPRRRLLIAAAAVAAVGVGLTPLLVLGPAYAVTPLPEGLVKVTIDFNRLDDPTALTADLRATGMNVAMLRQTAGCTQRPVGLPATAQVIRPEYQGQSQGSKSVVVLRPAAMPAGTVLVVALPPKGPHGAVMFTVASKAPECVPLAMDPTPSVDPASGTPAPSR